MRLSPAFSRIFCAGLLTLWTLSAGAADLYQTVRADCEGSANLSAVRNGKLGEILDVQVERTAVIGQNVVQRLLIGSNELWSVRFVTADANRGASLVVMNQEEVEVLLARVRAARVVEWVGPCYQSIRIDGEDVHASEDPMITSDRWVREAK